MNMSREQFVRNKKEEELRELRMEEMRKQVMEVELQARYWKAMHETKYWTLEDNKLKEPYEKYFLEVQTRAEDAAEQLGKLQEISGGIPGMESYNEDSLS